MNNEQKPQLTIPRVSGSVIFRDLCIGNLVTDEFYDSFKTIITVNSIDERGINLEIEDDGNNPEGSYNEWWLYSEGSYNEW